MPIKLTRRQAIIGGLSAVGIVAAGRWSGGYAEAAPAAAATAAAPADKSADAPTAPVAIQRCESYEPKVVRAQLDAALNLVGGLGDLVRGKTVTIKINATGGLDPAAGLPASRTYHTHPAVVAATCAILADAGAKQIYVVEGFFFRNPVEKAMATVGWDIEAIKAAGDHRVAFENTRNRGAWPAYSRVKVPWGGFVYPAFDLNARYEKTDVFISVAKLKDHCQAGITASMKNLFGITPQALYGDDAPNEDGIEARAEIMHEASKKVPEGVPGDLPVKALDGHHRWMSRVPRIVIDCVGARPIDLAIVDSVETVTGGEGPWQRGLKHVSPKLLMVGRNAVCTDAVCAGVMGYDPQAKPMQRPFQGENHLHLAASAGIGTNDLKRIEVRGLKIAEAKFPFDAPANWEAAGRPYYSPQLA